MMLILETGFELNDHDGVPLAFRGCPSEGPIVFLSRVDHVRMSLEGLLMEVEELICTRIDKWSLGLVPPKMLMGGEGDEGVRGGELLDVEKPSEKTRRAAASGGYCRFTRCYKNKRPAPAFSGLPRLLYCTRRVWLLLEAAQLIRDGRISWALSYQSNSSNMDESERSSGGSSSEGAEREGGGEGEGEGKECDLAGRTQRIMWRDQNCGVA